ncbi:hypothetical protein JXO59_04215 [candidate division KSB1 bacterium]|nr:hypothetical protein [candidate division KSB1 bacterium]
MIPMTILLASTTSFSQGNGYQQYFRFVGPTYPGDDENEFSEEANGITHDDNHWYIADNDGCNLWKIPVGIDLDGIQSNTMGVFVLRIDRISCPTQDGPKMLKGDLNYGHFGDLVAYKAKNQKYYLLVPISGGTPGPAIAVFRADNLQCLGLGVLWIDAGKTKQNDAAGWCAADLEGYIYTSPNWWNFAGDPVVKLFKYSLNWDEIASAIPKLVKLTYVETIPLLNEFGQPLPEYEIGGWAQGGEFSTDGKLLYVTSGCCGGGWCSGESEPGYNEYDKDEEHWGIHVFDAITWKRIARSREESFFHYNIPGEEEPEGLTVWDLEEGRNHYWDPPIAPNIIGQLHVLLLNNDFASDDNVSIFHYTNTTYVDHSYAGETDPDGVIIRPFKTVNDALNFYNQYEYFDYGRWTGGRIKIQSGSYDEAVTFSRKVQILPWTGKAVVGSQGRLSLKSGGVINIRSGGALKIH